MLVAAAARRFKSHFDWGPELPLCLLGDFPPPSRSPLGGAAAAGLRHTAPKLMILPIERASAAEPVHCSSGTACCRACRRRCRERLRDFIFIKSPAPGRAPMPQYWSLAAAGRLSTVGNAWGQRYRFGCCRRSAAWPLRRCRQY